MSWHRRFGADGWRFYALRLQKYNIFLNYARIWWGFLGNFRSVGRFSSGVFRYMGTTTLRFSFGVVSEFLRYSFGEVPMRFRWSPYEVPMKSLWSPYAHRGQSKGIQKESPRGYRRDITMCDKEIDTSKAKIILLIYNSICFARISSSRKIEAESENLVADSVVKNVQLPLDPAIARSAMSLWRSR